MDPILIAGMHRSGTSILTKCLKSLGLYIGSDTDIKHYESQLFVNANELILSQANCTWDNIHNYKFVDDYLTNYLYQRTCNYIKHGDKYLDENLRKKYNWGWKDPRNTITYNIWFNIFKKAKILYIIRNPIDVAISLYNRELAYRNDFLKAISFNNELLNNNNIKIQRSIRMLNINEALLLCSEYIEYIFNAINKLDNNKYLIIRYEDLLNNTFNILKEVSVFCNLPIDDKSISNACKYIRKKNHSG